MTEQNILAHINEPLVLVVGSKSYDIFTIKHYTNNGPNTFKVYYKIDGKEVSGLYNGDTIRLKPKEWKPLVKHKSKYKKGSYVKVIGYTKDKPPFYHKLVGNNHPLVGEVFIVDKFKNGYVLIKDEMFHDDTLEKLTKEEYSKELLYKPLKIHINNIIENANSSIRQLESNKSKLIRDFISTNRQIDILNETKNKDKNELINELIKKVSTDISRVNKDKRIKECYFDGGCITIKTNPIKVRCNTLLIHKDFHYLPPAKININMSNINIKIYKDGSYKNCIVKDSYFHPHISSSNEPCLGDIKSGLYEYISKFNIYMMSMAMLEMLETYNPDDPYIKIENLYKDTFTCDNCGKDTIFYKCPNCGKTNSSFNKEDFYN